MYAGGFIMRTNLMQVLILRGMDKYCMEMANLVPKRTGLSVNIWSDGCGIHRNKSDNTKRIKLVYNSQYSVSITIEEHPRVLACTGGLKKKAQGSPEWRAINAGIDYVGRNYDIFLKHYDADTPDDFDDQDLFDALRARGEFK